MSTPSKNPLSPTRGELDAAAAEVGADNGGFATIYAHWFGPSFLPLLKPGELLAFLYVLTRCQGRKRPWSIPAEEVAGRCGLGRETAIHALATVRSLGVFSSHQSRDFDGSPRWYYQLREPADWNLSDLNAFIESRRQTTGKTAARRSAVARQQRPEGSETFRSPSQVEPDGATSDRTSPGLVRCDLESPSGKTSPIGVGEYVSENVLEDGPAASHSDALNHLEQEALKYPSRTAFDKAFRKFPVDVRSRAWKRVWKQERAAATEQEGTP